MCGIAGFFNYKVNAPVDRDKLQNVLEAMRYRGPDHLGIYAEGNIALGNVRLSIQDTSSQGNQPIFNEDRSVVVVFNGEIYNYPELKKDLESKGHRFNSHTDTECLVHLYEEYDLKMPSFLNGMFAFALFDLKKRMLILGRDRTAQKPLFLHRNKTGLFFSSEIKTMLPYLESRSLNAQAVMTFLSMGYTLEPQTIIQEIETAEPGCLHVFKLNDEKIIRYWNLTDTSDRKIERLEEWKEKADIIFKKAVKRHLLSDVPVTLLLSGGIDSSLLALYLREEGKIEKSYTGSFIGYGDHDEYNVAVQLGQYCGFKPVRIDLSDSVLKRHLDSFLERSSQPQGDYSGLATFAVAQEVSREYRVVLGGDGGDELFGGYPTYCFPYLAKKYSYLRPWMIRLAGRFSRLWFDKKRYMSVPFRIQQLALAWGKDSPQAHFALKNFLPSQLGEKILKKELRERAANSTNPPQIFTNCYEQNNFSDVVEKLCWIDFCTFLRSGTIPKVERNSMLFSLEARLPYLDNEVLQLSFETAASLKVCGMDAKLALKSLLMEKVRNKISFTPVKHGFSPPLVALFDGSLRQWKDQWLQEPAIFLTPDSYQTVRQWKKRGWDLHRLEWNIAVLKDWCQRNNITR